MKLENDGLAFQAYSFFFQGHVQNKINHIHDTKKKYRIRHSKTSKTSLESVDASMMVFVKTNVDAIRILFKDAGDSSTAASQPAA